MFFEDAHDTRKKKGRRVDCVSYIQGVVYKKINVYLFTTVKII